MAAPEKTASIVVVKRPRGGLFAAVRSVPVWLRALSRSAPCSRPLVLAAAEPDSIPPTATPLDREILRAGLAERGAVLLDGPGVGTCDATGEASRRGPAHGRDRAWIVELPAASSGALLRWLRDEPVLGFDVLEDLTVIDRLPDSPRFEVVYCLRASASGARLRLRACIEAEPPEIDSTASLWRSADWLEREAKDLFGVRFVGHPGLQPILLPPDFEGAPLRRDFASLADAAEAVTS